MVNAGKMHALTLESLPSSVAALLVTISSEVERAARQGQFCVSVAIPDKILATTATVLRDKGFVVEFLGSEVKLRW